MVLSRQLLARFIFIRNKEIDFKHIKDQHQFMDACCEILKVEQVGQTGWDRSDSPIVQPVQPVQP